MEYWEGVFCQKLARWIRNISGLRSERSSCCERLQTTKLLGTKNYNSIPCFPSCYLKGGRKMSSCPVSKEKKKKGCYYIWRLPELQTSESELAVNRSAFFSIQKKVLRREEKEHMQHFEPQACMKSDLECARWNNSYGCTILNSRNTTCWWLPEIGRASRCASVGQRGSPRAAPVVTAPRGACLITAPRFPGSVYILISNTEPRHPRTNGCLFRQPSRTGFHCNLCRVWQWKHHSWVSLGEETAAQQCK